MLSDVIANQITEQLTKVTLSYIAEQISKFARSLEKTPNERPAQTADELKVGGTLLPTVGIIGIGRCGTNIALDVANTIFTANQLTLTGTSKPEDSVAEAPDTGSQKPASLASWVLRRLGKESGDKGEGGLFLIDPVILAADLDGDTSARIRTLNPALVAGSLRFKVTDLQWLHSGGAGNIPVVGQYMATLAMVATTEAAPEAWKQHRSYIIDSSGLNVNRSRLYFYLFSCGGGSGSGMASVFGLAQQRARIINIERRAVEDQKGAKKSNVSEPICSVGIGILPDVPGENSSASAQHYNAGRLLCSYLAQKNRFDMKFRAGSTDDVMMFNCLLLVSNDMMKYALDKVPEKNSPTTAVKAEQMANHYIAQQIFNLLTAQALIQDYSSEDPRFIESMKSAGISLGDTVKLDASDLYNCLSGPAVVGYAEQLDEKEKFDRLFARAVSPPAVNNKDNVIEGLSVLPCPFEKYQKVVQALEGGDVSSIREIPLFKRAISVVVIIAAPRGDSLNYADMTVIKGKVDQCFPAAAIKRYAFVLGTSRRCSLTLLISGSACSTLDVYYPLSNYIFGAFGKDLESADDFSGKIDELLNTPEFDSKKCKELLNPVESLRNVLVGVGDGVWELQKLEHEQKFASFAPKAAQSSAAISDRIEPAISLEEMLLKDDDVVEALQYLHRLEHHKPTQTVRSSRYN